MNPTSAIGALATSLVVATLAIGGVACRGDGEPPPAPPSHVETEAPADAEASPVETPDPPAAPELAETPPEEAEQGAEGPGAEALPKEAPAAAERDRLWAAYIASYCAQRRGDTLSLRAIHVEHGFEEPARWREAWERAAKDSEWLAEITQAAIAACP